MMVEQLDSHMQDYELSPIPYILHKYYVKIDYITRWNGKYKSCREKIEKKPCDLVGNWFLDTKPIIMIHDKNNLYFIKNTMLRE